MTPLAVELTQLLRSSTRTIDRGISVEPDEATVTRLDEIVEEIGWPTRSKVGGEAADKFGELAKQVRDVERKERWLGLIREQPPGEVNPRHIAQFEDGLRLLEGRPLLYGTMYRRDDVGDLMPVPVEDPERLDERRSAIGLNSQREELEILRAASRS